MKSLRLIGTLAFVAGCGAGTAATSGAGGLVATEPDGGSAGVGGMTVDGPDAGVGGAAGGVAGAGGAVAGGGGMGGGGGAGGAGAGGAGAGGAGMAGAGGTGGAGMGGAGAGGASQMCAPPGGGSTNDRAKLALAALEVSDPNPPQKEEATYANLAYDAQRGVLMLFGGQTSQGEAARTWRWDGTSFTELASAAASPTARTGFAMVYDSGRGRIVLFGGRARAGGLLDDVWEWDGARWSQIVAPVRPPARTEHALAYDAARSRTVLFGGTGADGAQSNDTWEWDGATWHQATPTGDLPLPRRFHALAYDPGRARTLLFGGDREGSGSTQIIDRGAWEWDGQSWQRAYGSSDGGSTCNGQRPCVWPRGGAHVAMAYDAALGGVVAYSGTIWSHVPYNGPNTPDADRRDIEDRSFWLFRGQAWSQLFADGDWPSAEAYQYFPADNIFPTESPNVHHWGMSYDECRQRIVLFRHNHVFSGARVNEVEVRFSPNTAPTLSRYPAGSAPRQVFPGRSVSFLVQGSDADQDVLSFTSGALPTGAITYQDGPTGRPDHMSFSWPTTAAQAGEYSVDFHVTDGLATTTLTVPIHVGPITYTGITASGAVQATGAGDFQLGQTQTRWDDNGTTPIGDVNQGLVPARATCTLSGSSPGELALRCTVSVTPTRDLSGSTIPTLTVMDAAPLPLPEDLTAQSYAGTSGQNGRWSTGLVPNADGTVSVTLSNVEIRWGSSMAWRNLGSTVLQLSPM